MSLRLFEKPVVRMPGTLSLLLVFVSSIIITAITVLATINIYKMLYGACQDAEPETLSAICRDWQYQSDSEKYIDGPEAARQCQDYLKDRSPQERVADEEIHRRKLDEAKKAWEREK